MGVLIEDNMDYSFEPKARYKEMKYFRYSIYRDMLYEEIIYCRNEMGFLKFLDDMNSKEIHSKYFSRIDRTIHKEVKQKLLFTNAKKTTRWEELNKKRMEKRLTNEELQEYNRLTDVKAVEDQYGMELE